MCSVLDYLISTFSARTHFNQIDSGLTCRSHFLQLNPEEYCPTFYTHTCDNVFIDECVSMYVYKDMCVITFKNGSIFTQIHTCVSVVFVCYSYVNCLYFSILRQ